MSEIHPTAVIHPGATLGGDCVVGPYCVIGGHVTLGEGNRLHSHVVIDGHTEIGTGNEFFPFASIGLKTQDLKWKGGTTWTRIGNNNTFRENVTVHSATGDGEATVMGSDNHILAYSHIAHNVLLGDHVILSNNGTLAGHVIVEDHAIVGGLSAVHQFCRLGQNVDHRRLHKSGERRGAVHDGGRQPGDEPECREQGGAGAQRCCGRGTGGAAPGASVVVSQGFDHRQRAGGDPYRSAATGRGEASGFVRRDQRPGHHALTWPSDKKTAPMPERF